MNNMASKSQHVVPSTRGGWSVKKEGASKATKNFETKVAAVKFGREVSKNSKSELYIHKKDGTIQQRDSYSNPPFPPRNRK